MFRTFRSNPALGGFGSESTASSDLHDASTTPDAFCQIIKELVDNAIDACTISSTESAHSTASNIYRSKSSKGKCNNARTQSIGSKRVRVVIEKFNDSRMPQDSNENDKSSHAREILRVTVSDNGCGMHDIQACVGAFHSSKAYNSTTKTTATKTTKLQEKNGTKSRAVDRASDAASPQPQTAGRYGIGLTLCLLHAQRLVPDSCASIQSAVETDKEWTAVTAVVDTASDTVRCFPRKSNAKTNENESGTAISVLVPVRLNKGS
jgi:Histidine kinase-, DNA gyrase B-, and HSP90-like ATPase